jgi:hypothetical protein
MRPLNAAISSSITCAGLSALLFKRFHGLAVLEQQQSLGHHSSGNHCACTPLSEVISRDDD